MKKLQLRGKPILIIGAYVLASVLVILFLILANRSTPDVAYIENTEKELGGGENSVFLLNNYNELASVLVGEQFAVVKEEINRYCVTTFNTREASITNKDVVQNDGSITLSITPKSGSSYNMVIYRDSIDKIRVLYPGTGQVKTLVVSEFSDDQPEQIER